MIQTFRESIADSTKLRSLHEHCVGELNLPGDYSDLLRTGVVYCMSALDKLVHDIVLHEMVEIFVGRRPTTPKFLAESMSLDSHLSLVNATIPPAEIVFEGIVRVKLNYQSFMDPIKLSDALSLVWLESQKWQVIAASLGSTKEQITTELRNICKRRNAIVHEADRDPSTNQKLPIYPADTQRIECFILQLGETIYRLV